MKQDAFVSVVLVSNNQSATLVDYIEKLSPQLSSAYCDHEIIVIDQNSNDDTESKMSSLLTQYQSIRYIKLASEVHHDVAVSSGLENAIGDFVVVLNIETDPTDIVADFVKECRSGSDIVIGVAEASATFMYNKIRPLINVLLKSIGYSLPRNATGSFCLSRRTVNAVTESGRFHHKLHVTISNTGYPTSKLNYDYLPRTGESDKKNIVNGIQEGLHYTIFNSTKPLRWMSIIGVVGSFTAFVFAVYSLLVNLFNHHVTEGWTTTILFMSAMFFLMFTMLAFFGEYLARLLDDRSEHKEYTVVFEKNSSVMLDIDRCNVLYDSVSEEVNHVQTGRNC